MDREERRMLVTEFVIKTGSSTRNLLWIAEILAESGVNLTTVSLDRLEGMACIRLLTSDEEACTRALMKADLDYCTREVLVAEVEDKPGQWAKIARKLADGGLEILSSYLLSKDGKTAQVVFAVDDPKKGEKILSQTKAKKTKKKKSKKQRKKK
jgi:hypothetical protein